MTRARLLTGAFVAVFAAAPWPAAAQDSRQPSSSAESSGSAVPRDSGSSSGSSSSGPSSSSSGGGGSSSDSTSSSAPSTHNSSPDRPRTEYFVAPSHPSERQQTRQRGEGDSRQPSGGSTSSGARAVPRGGGDGGGAGTTRGTQVSGGSDEAPSRRAVPAYSRPRGNRPQTGTAVERSDAIRGGDGISYRPFGYGSGYYISPYRMYYMPGAYGFGLGYFYDPFWFDPYGYDSYGFGYSGGGYYGGTGRSSYTKAPTGSLRLKIKPTDAQVYVDGYFVGDIDSFDGVFQKLELEAGGHRVEIRAEGYDPVQLDVNVSPGETVTFKGDLKRK